MPHKKKAPARTKKFLGGALAAARKKRRTTQAKNMAGLSADQRNLLGQAQAHAFKQGKGTKAINDYTKKYGLTKAGKAAASKAAAKAGIKLGKINKRTTPRIMSTVTGARKAKELAAKRRTGGVAMSAAARAAMKKKQMEAMRGRSGRRIKQRPARGGILARAKRVIAGGRGKGPSKLKRVLGRSTTPRRTGAANPRAALLARRRAAAARRRPSTMSRAAAARRRAAAARRRATTRSRRPGRPALRRPVARRAVRRVTRRR